MMPCKGEQGISLVEVLVAAVIGTVAVVGTFEAVQAATRAAQQGMIKTRAITLVQIRLEAKRSVRWDGLLHDDVNHDGVVDRTMQDDGMGPDLSAGDGVYTGIWEQDGVRLVWTVATEPRGPVSQAGLVIIEATASYQGINGLVDVRMTTMRANPHYVGVQ